MFSFLWYLKEIQWIHPPRAPAARASPSWRIVSSYCEPKQTPSSLSCFSSIFCFISKISHHDWLKHNQFLMCNVSNMTFPMNPGRAVSVPNGCCASSEKHKTLLTNVLFADIPVGSQSSRDWLPKSTSHQEVPGWKGMAHSVVSMVGEEAVPKWGSQ